MDKKQKTIDSYNKSAQAIADKFDNQGARTKDIVEVFKLVDKSQPMVLEIGCGNGRDAEEILKFTPNYLGFDISEELIKLARKKVPTATFEVADVETYVFSYEVDIVFAFASLLHVDHENLERIFQKVHSVLKPGGIFRLSLKYNDKYKDIEKEDEFGTRVFYLYSEEDIREIAIDFTIVKMELVNKREQMWVEAILRKD